MDPLSPLAELVGSDTFWVLRLYVDGTTELTNRIVAHLRAVCDSALADQYSLEVFDLGAQPELGAADHILALPTLVRKLPVPTRKIIGDLLNTNRLRVALNLPSEDGRT